ncbi:MAG: 50S ribosomal protein L30 [Acetatifactor sp.]|jgi:large subunit ribosomal protein L30|nr:50S ribosomal protein L30 [Lachnospiraceae bacterium]MDE6168900.1 50S ribosomal protein L30 [Acetatifactor sp.]MDE7352910.1 50S ribosomal protein L30 [Acetatifactor sp.]
MADKKLKITLVKSTIGAVPKNKAIVESMGLRKIGRTIILPDNDATRGQIRQVGHMLKVEEVEEA